MKTKVLHTDTDTGAYIEMLEFKEGTADEWENVHSYPVRQMHVVSSNRAVLKIFRDAGNVRMGKGRAQQIKAMLDDAKEWLSSYIYHARYPTKEFGCNNILGQTCPLMKAGSDGRAKCSITPYSWGYGGNTGGSRDVPVNHQCDLFGKLSSESARSLGGEIPGKSINMYELWTCITGEAKKKLFAKNEENNHE